MSLAIKDIHFNRLSKLYLPAEDEWFTYVNVHMQKILRNAIVLYKKQ